MIRIQKLNIKCPVCDKPDWCLVSEDGSAAICRRTEKGSVKKCGKAGWLHILGDFNPQKYQIPEKPYVDWAKHTFQFGLNALNHGGEMRRYLRQYQLNWQTVMRFNVGWTNGWLTIPMYGVNGKTTGIQRRQKKTKRFMLHSEMGVFLPSAFLQYKAKTLAVCEGWTDTVAALEYGFAASVGKMNAFVGDELVLYYAKRLGCERAIIFADYNDDGVGQDGAQQTAGLLCNEMEVMVVQTPSDLRDCKLKGMSIQEVINNG